MAPKMQKNAKVSKSKKASGSPKPTIKLITPTKVTKASKPAKPAKPAKRTPPPKKVPSVPRQDSPNVIDPRNCTSFHPEQASWSWDNLPDILYQLKPTTDEKGVNRKERPPNMAYPIHGKILAAFSVLPDNISSAVCEYQVEAWTRLDRRIRLQDITDRMHPEFRVMKNALQQRGVRFRQSFHLLAWDSGNRESMVWESTVAALMTQNGVNPKGNTTRGVTPGLINPALGEEGGRVPLPRGYGNRNRFAATRAKSTRDAELIKFISKTVVPEERREQADEVLSVVQGDTSNETISVTQSETSDEVLSVIQDETSDGTLSVVQDETSDEILSVTEGETSDEELQATVFMDDIDMSLQSEPEARRITVTMDLTTDDEYDFSYVEPSPSVFRKSFCNSSLCYPCTLKTPQQTLQSTIPVFYTPETPQTPTRGIFPAYEPVHLNTFAQEEQKDLFDVMLAEYYADQRYLVEMPGIEFSS